MAKITYEQIRRNEKFTKLVTRANDYLDILGYTDHGPRHVGYVSKIAADILFKLGYPEERVELARIAGWIHDVGNFVNRKYHALSGALILYDELQKIGMDYDDVCDICSAVGSHDEEIGKPISDISAALIIADKVDTYKKRVRNNKPKNDLHGRVNMAIHWTNVNVDAEKNKITFELKMQDYASPMEFLQIYANRMVMCQDSANFLGCTFKLIINGLVMNRIAHEPGREPKADV